MIPLHALTEAWESFFFAPEIPLPVAVFRILIGITLVANALLLWPDARLWFGPRGFISDSDYRRVYGRRRFTLLNYLPPSDASVHLLLSLHLVAALFLTAGLFTNASAAVVFVTLVSLHHRNSAITHSGDSVLRLMTFLLIFSPAGAALSLDNLLRVRSGLGDASLVPTAPWCLRLMQLQLSILYFRTFVLKLQGSRWLDGTAAYYPTQVLEFRRFTLPACFNNSFFIKLATWGTLFTEFALGPLVWVRELRYPVVLCGALLHLTLEVLMNLQLFGWIMLSCLVLFIYPEDLLKLLQLLHVLRP